MKSKKAITLSILFLFSLTSLSLSVGCGGPKCGGQESAFNAKWKPQEVGLPKDQEKTREKEAKEAKETWTQSEEEGGWTFVREEEGEDGKVYAVFSRKPSSTKQTLESSEGEESDPVGGEGEGTMSNDDDNDQDSEHSNSNGHDQGEPNSDQGLPKGVRAKGTGSNPTSEDDAEVKRVRIPNFEDYIKGDHIPKSVKSFKDWQEFSSDSVRMVCTPPKEAKTFF